MFKLKFILFAFLIAGSIPAYSGNADPVLQKNTTASVPVPDTRDCNLPAPTNLQATNITTNSITVTWTPVAGAGAYTVYAFDDVTNMPLLPTQTAAASSAVLAPLPAGTAVRVEVAAICPNGEESPNRVIEVFRTNIIIDLVAEGYECTNRTSFWSADLNPNAQLSVQIPIPSHYLFKVTKDNIDSKYDIYINGSTFFIGEISNYAGEFDGEGDVTTFMQGNNPKFNVNVTSPFLAAAMIDFEGLAFRGTYTLSLETCNDPSGRGGLIGSDETVIRSASELSAGQTATISPNPFTNNLQVAFPQNNSDETANVQLFHISGTLIDTRTGIAENGGSCQFETASIPSGMYLLRVESPSGTYTRLVTKTN